MGVQGEQTVTGRMSTIIKSDSPNRKPTFELLTQCSDSATSVAGLSTSGRRLQRVRGEQEISDSSIRIGVISRRLIRVR